VFPSVDRLADPSREFVELHGHRTGRCDDDIRRIRLELNAHHGLTETPLRTIPPYGAADATGRNNPNLRGTGLCGGTNHGDPSRTARFTSAENGRKPLRGSQRDERTSVVRQ